MACLLGRSGLVGGKLRTKPRYGNGTVSKPPAAAEARQHEGMVSPQSGRVRFRYKSSISKREPDRLGLSGPSRLALLARTSAAGTSRGLHATARGVHAPPVLGVSLPPPAAPISARGVKADPAGVFALGRASDVGSPPSSPPSCSPSESVRFVEMGGGARPTFALLIRPSVHVPIWDGTGDSVGAASAPVASAVEDLDVLGEAPLLRGDELIELRSDELIERCSLERPVSSETSLIASGLSSGDDSKVPV
eukprot:scaffold2078_cov34-Tisochrysis_lutea.AAC.4